jgi:pimeloyl-ACP methyl ester carboxylesterase
MAGIATAGWLLRARETAWSGRCAPEAPSWRNPMSRTQQNRKSVQFFLVPARQADWARPCFVGTTMTLQSQKLAVVTVVLVHGAWADGSSWNEVIARLQAEGIPVVSVQNPLSSLSDDVAAVQRAMELVDGRLVLVGHSWGGTVITQAGAAGRVRGLVYIAAFAPDRGQSTNSLQAGYPRPEYASLLRADSAGYLHFPADALPHYFAQDLPATNAIVLAATQGPIHASAFDDKVTEAAWHDIPSWYLVTDHDRMILPQLQREMAQRMQARIREVPASHVPFASRPKETTAIILEAVAEAAR